MMATWAQYVEFLLGKGNLDEVMIISAEDGEIWASSSPEFQLRTYKATIAQEDGTDREETVDEAANVIAFINGKKPPQGLRINSKKHQVFRTFKEEETGLTTLYGKITQGGSSVVHAGNCVLIGTFAETKGHTSAGCYDLLRLMGGYLVKSKWPSSGGEGIEWQKVLDEKLLGKGNVSKALIVDTNESKILAGSPGFQLTVYEAEIAQEDGTDRKEKVDETKNIITLLGGKKPSQGLRIEGIKFQILRSFDDDQSGCYTVYGKRAKGGCCLAATNKAIIVALFDEAQGHTAAACNDIVATVAKALKQSNN